MGQAREEGGAKISYKPPWIHQGSMDTVQVAGSNGMWDREKEIPDPESGKTHLEPLFL